MTSKIVGAVALTLTVAAGVGACGGSDPDVDLKNAAAGLTAFVAAHPDIDNGTVGLDSCPFKDAPAGSQDELSGGSPSEAEIKCISDSEGLIASIEPVKDFVHYSDIRKTATSDFRGGTLTTSALDNGCVALFSDPDDEVLLGYVNTRNASRSVCDDKLKSYLDQMVSDLADLK